MKRPSARRDSRKPGFSTRNLWPYLLCFLLGLLVTGSVVFAVKLARGNSAPKSSAPRLNVGNSAPWGDLEYTSITLQRPQDSSLTNIPNPEPILWNFKETSRETLQQFIASIDLTPDQKNLLLDPTRWKELPANQGWQLSPPLELVRDMSPAARKQLYSTLRRNPQNEYLYTPLRIPAQRFDSWLTDSHLPADKTNLVRRLVIPEDDMFYLYDGLLMEWICSPEEKKNLAVAISQTPTLIMKLRVTPQSDLNALQNYWARGNRGRTMRPFLESLARVSGGTTVNVSFFFPTFPRLRLYTYPDPTKAMASRKDCFYTAMNFFNEKPDFRFLNSDQIQASLRADYTEVKTNWAFGDVIMLKNSENFAVHMCVYIADNVVFTKNGANLLSPWVLMSMPDMLKEYRSEKSLTMAIYRKKTI